MTEWRNRIVRYGMAKVEEVLANPYNFRIHSKLQQEALSGSLDTLGWISVVIINVTTGRLIDGHLRIILALRKGEKEVPAIYVELSEAEEAQAGNIGLKDLKYIAFYDKPLVKFERLLETYVDFSPKGIKSFLAAMPVWMKEKLFQKKLLQDELLSLDGIASKSALPQILFGEHHESHAASAFYPSPFQSAAVLCMDGVGEWSTTSAWSGDGDNLQPLWEIRFPHSLGLLYSAFTYYTGFRVNSGEYKVLGLAPYGQPKFVQAIYDHLIDLKSDGTFRLKMEYFNYCTGLTMTNGKFDDVFGGPPRKPESKLTQRDMDLARSIQEVTEEVVLRLVRGLHRETGAETYAWLAVSH